MMEEKSRYTVILGTRSAISSRWLPNGSLLNENVPTKFQGHHIGYILSKDTSNTEIYSLTLHDAIPFLYGNIKYQVSHFRKMAAKRFTFERKCSYKVSRASHRLYSNSNDLQIRLQLTEI